jgi:pimeloyl-ACP methyl ester carboxylesterase
MSQHQVARVPSYAGSGSEAELIEGVGHFMLVERPEEINRRITDWLGRTGARQDG